MGVELKLHWENIYFHKSDLELSWYQKVPATSLRLIDELNLNKKESVIDVGGGNSNLAIELLKRGYDDLTVIDISRNSLQRMKHKLGHDSKQINWIESDILELDATKKFHLWHDRAVFHFLTDLEHRNGYISNLLKLLQNRGIFILSTFSTSGPNKCSGLNISQYEEKSLQSLFSEYFELLEIFNEDHKTPAGSTQNFVYSVWRKRN